MVWCEITNSWKPRWGYMRAEKASVSRLCLQNSNSNSAIEQKRRIERLGSRNQAARRPERWSVGKRKKRKERASGEEEWTTRKDNKTKTTCGTLPKEKIGGKKKYNALFSKDADVSFFIEKVKTSRQLILERVKTDFGFDVGEESEIQQKRGGRQSSQFWEKESCRKSAETKQPLEIGWQIEKGKTAGSENGVPNFFFRNSS